MIEKLNKFHDSDEHYKIIEAIESLPPSDLNFELRGLLGRAYNNASNYKKALEVLFHDSLEGDNDALWNFRVGYAYFYEGEKEKALLYFQKSADLGDTDALLFVDMCTNKDYERTKTYKPMIGEYQETFNGKPVKTFEIGDTIDSSFSYRIESEYDAQDKVVDKLNDLVNRNLTDSMEELIIGTWQDAYEEDPSAILGIFIENKEKFSNLKHVFFGDMIAEDCEISWIQQTNYDQFFNTFPQLETFQVRGGEGLTLGNFKAPSLKRLVIETGGLSGEVIENITHASASLTNLEHMEIWLGTEDYGADTTTDQLKALLSKEFPKLTYLGLMNSDMQNDVAALMKDHPILDQLETLDLSMGTLTNEGAKTLFENEGLLKLKHLNCRYHFITDEWVEKLKAKFADQNINLGDQEGIEDDWVFVEVGE